MATQGWVRFLCRAKIILYSQMNSNLATLEPASTALGEFPRFGNLRHAEQVAIEAAGCNFPARRHGELDVIDGSKRDTNHVRVLI